MGKKNVHQEWVVDESCDQNDIGYWFSRNYGSCAGVTLQADGSLVFDGLRHKVIIRNIGTENEQVMTENVLDLTGFPRVF